MFTVKGERAKEDSLSFGLAKIYEVDGAGNQIDEVKEHKGVGNQGEEHILTYLGVKGRRAAA